MATNERPIQFRDYLPEVFRAGEVDGVSFLSRFLQAFERLFEGLQGEIEGAPGAASGGIPDLFDPDTTPPPQFEHRPQPDFDYLNYLASWIALRLRAEKSVAWNRRFFNAALPLVRQSGTLPGLDALLRAWLKDDLMETSPPLLILTDLTRAHTDVNAVFQSGVTATLGVDTVLGEGAPFFFIADLVADPVARALRQPEGLDVFQQAARSLLDAQKPAHTYYQLRVRARPMQLAPAEQAPAGGFPFPYAQLGVTTMLWEEPWTFTSDC